MVGNAFPESRIRIRTNVHLARIVDTLHKCRRIVPSVDHHNRWDLDTQFWTITEIPIECVSKPWETTSIESPLAAEQSEADSCLSVRLCGCYRIVQSPTEHHNEYRDVYDFLQNTLQLKICKNWPGMLEKSVIILHNNCRVHASRIFIDLLAIYGWEALSHPAYSPDLSSRDYDLNPKLKEESMPGVRFWDIQELMARLAQEIRRVNREGVLDRMQMLPTRWKKYVGLHGDYIEWF